MRAPAFQFYPSDWLGSQRVALMTLEEEGAYIRALAFCWGQGGVPSDPQKLAFLIGKGASTTVATTVASMFEPDPNRPGYLLSARLEEVRAKQAEWREKSIEGGKRSGEVRKLRGDSTKHEPPLEPNTNHGSTTVQPPLEPKGNTPTPSPTPTPSVERPIAPASPDAKEKAPPKPREPNPAFDALCEVAGLTGKLTPREASRIGMSLKQIRAAMPDGAELPTVAVEIRHRAENYRKTWPGMTLTDTALVAHWSKMEKGGTGSPRPLSDSDRMAEKAGFKI